MIVLAWLLVVVVAVILPGPLAGAFVWAWLAYLTWRARTSFTADLRHLRAGRGALRARRSGGAHL